jgi:hypothetical protein
LECCVDEAALRASDGYTSADIVEKHQKLEASSMGNVQNDVLTERHLAAFGAILQCFASYELTIERAIAGLLHMDASNIAILMRQLDFTAKRLAFLDLLPERSIPGDRWERIFAHLSVPSSHVGLRNHIAHSTWKASPEPKSIQPDWILRWVLGIVTCLTEIG